MKRKWIIFIILLLVLAAVAAAAVLFFRKGERGSGSARGGASGIYG